MKKYIRSSELYDRGSVYTPYIAYYFDKRQLRNVRDFINRLNLLDCELDLNEGLIKIRKGDRQKFEQFIDGLDYITFAGYSR